MDTMNVNVAGMSRIQMVKLMDEMREAARQQLVDAIADTPMTAKQIAERSGQTYYTDVDAGVHFGAAYSGGVCWNSNGRLNPNAKFLADERAITHRFVEVDENGDILDGGRTIEKLSLETYYYLNPYFKGDD